MARTTVQGLMLQRLEKIDGRFDKVEEKLSALERAAISVEEKLGGLKMKAAIAGGVAGLVGAQIAPDEAIALIKKIIG